MRRRTGGLLAAIAMVLPLTAEANCAARIAALEDSAAMPAQSAGGDAGERVVQEDGGQTTHQSGGPALPEENWFTDDESNQSGSVVTHLDSAKEAQAAGDEQACLDAVEQAEAALPKD